MKLWLSDQIMSYRTVGYQNDTFDDDLKFEVREHQFRWYLFGE